MIIVRGGGDIATGTIYRLARCGYAVLILETEKPTAIRRRAAFCEAVYDGAATVEGITCRRVEKEQQCCGAWQCGEIPLMVDPQGEMIKKLHPQVVVDAILAKKNLGTNREMAPLTVALGPGFCAGRDVDYVIETMRGHRLGRIIEEGYALPNTGVPGLIGGYGAERVIHAPASGRIHVYAQIGEVVEKGQTLAVIEACAKEGQTLAVIEACAKEGQMPAVLETRSEKGLTSAVSEAQPEKGQTLAVIKACAKESQVCAAAGGTKVTATLSGVLRGMIRDGFPVTKGLKIADIDPRKEQRENCDTISDKARCIAGSVLEVVVRHQAARMGEEEWGR